MKNITVIFFFLFVVINTLAQDYSTYKWHDPIKTVDRFENQGWSNIGYNRFPDKAEKTVRSDVWNLSQHSAGLGVRFETNSDTITVQYQVNDNLAMNHMPATGVSGLDLYAKKDDDWLWCRGRYEFKDTIQYTFVVDALKEGTRQYQLLFPLYNKIGNIKIGVPNGKSLLFLKSQIKKPIIVYGTSIAQGACASRPGMAWTNILSRKLSLPVINLGFSGNGRLEAEVIELINEIDASVFVLDCLPNLSPNDTNTKKEIQNRIRISVNSIRSKHSTTPILLVQHAGYSDGEVDMNRALIYRTLNIWTNEIFEQLRAEGVKNLTMLTKERINLSNDAFVDGTHPNDLGMLEYAEAYEKILKEILK